MAAAKWTDAYSRERVYEGGNVDNPRDPGGRTSRGVTQRVYDAYRRRKNLGQRDVYRADEAEVAEIFKSQYWDAVQGDALPAGLDLVVLDGAINSGPKQSIKWLQAALGIGADGVMGQVTLDAIEGDANHDTLIAEIINIRLGFLHHLSTWSTFGAGWSARLANVKKVGEAWADQAAVQTAASAVIPAGVVSVAAPMPARIAPDSVSVEHLDGHQKAPVEAIKVPAVSVQQGAAITGGAMSLDGITNAVQGAAGHVQAVSDLSPLLHYGFVALTVAGVALTIYAAWRAFHAEKAKAGETYAVLNNAADAVGVHA